MVNVFIYKCHERYLIGSLLSIANAAIQQSPFAFSTMFTHQDLPAIHRALVQDVYAQPLVIRDVPTPQPTPGSVILRVEAAAVVSYQGEVYNGNRQYPYPTPMVPGVWSIGRVVAAGPDAVALQRGQLVWFDSFILARDDPSVAMLSGMSDVGHPGARKLMSGEWRDSSFAQFIKVPLENAFILDETRLCNSPLAGGLGYTVEQMTWIGMALVGYGGLRSIGLQAGETIIVAPATGGFGGAATLAAIAMGARVIAMGRNQDTLRQLGELSDRIHTVPMSGDHDAEVQALAKFGRADAFLDLSPPQATHSTHLKSAIRSLRKGGRVSLMGGQEGDVAFPYRELIFNDITLKGQWMFDNATVRDMIRLVETGLLEFTHVKVAGKFSLDQWEQAFEVAAGMKFDEVTVMSGW